MNVQTKIDKYQDVIDSRDIIARIEELTDERDTWIDEALDGETGPFTDNPNPVSVAADAWEGEYPEDAAELSSLEALASEASDYAPDWEYGETLIRDSYFTDYIMEMLEDCDTLPTDIPSYVEIDKEATAQNCQVDYTSVDYDGITYWIR